MTEEFTVSGSDSVRKSPQVSTKGGNARIGRPPLTFGHQAAFWGHEKV